MLDICRSVFVDIQALIREFDCVDGTVRLVGLKESGFFHLLPRIGFLKASAEEAPSVFVDIQALIREFDCVDGTVRLVGLKESGFFHLLPRIGFLKASAEEAPYVDVEEARKWCCVVVTNGKDGCTVYWKDGEVHIEPFVTVQVDPTGLAVPDAALLGNFFGSLNVGQIGLSKFDLRLLQRIKDEVQRRKMQCISCHGRRDDELTFMKPLGHEQFLASLGAVKSISTLSVQDCPWNLPRSPVAVKQEGIHPQYTGPQKFNTTLYEEPINTRIKDEVQRRKMQCISCHGRRDDELTFMKPLGHEQFLASLGAVKSISTLSVQDCPWNLPRSPVAVKQEGIHPQYSGPQKFNTTLYEEPINTVESKPRLPHSNKKIKIKINKNSLFINVE
ncbi:unnamed protein product [Ilex paraguariensis]|uniref:Uncharacterized protein n=1 Tax=Ilex paraguariensis TaxID=185542 RepID=A0ABC8SR62_9AQUA